MKYTTLFLDIGGVLLTNGWDHQSREKAAQHFDLNEEEMNKRHVLLFDTYEIGKLSLDEYIEGVVFYEPRPFSQEAFKQFMFDQSQAYSVMLQLMKGIKKHYNLKIVAVTNEGRELMVHRLNQFKLKEFIDFFICSAFVHLRKPDLDFYRLALDSAQVKPEEVIYIDDRPLLADMGRRLGMQAIQHISYEKTHQLLDVYLQG
jgi:putative hydrolase of the HAD superfamily